MNLQVTITPAKTRVVEEAPEIIMVPMTRREAECTLRLLSHCVAGGATSPLYRRLLDADVKPAVIRSGEILCVGFGEGTL